MLAFDLDGTLLNEKKQVTEGVRNALAEAISAGMEVVPATGRQLDGIPKEVLTLPGIRYALTANGARVVELASGKTVYEDCLGTQAALDVLAVINVPATAIALYVDGKAYCEKYAGEEFAPYFSAEILKLARLSRTKVESLSAFLQENQPKVEKFSILFSDLAVREELKAKLALRTDCGITSSLTNNLEINAPTANKGAALLALAKLLNIEPSQTMAIGDSDNDLEMLSAAGYGVAMGNAADHVRAVANAVTLSCEEDGVAHAIRSVLGVQ